MWWTRLFGGHYPPPGSWGYTDAEGRALDTTCAWRNEFRYRVVVSAFANE